VTDWRADRIAEVIAAMLSESHEIRASNHAHEVVLPEHELTIAVADPVVHDDGAFLEVPISIGEPDWGYAWDRSVGVAREDSHPLTEALLSWTHNVLPLFIAVRRPDHPLAADLHRTVMPDASGADVRILAGPVTIRRFSGLSEQFEQAVAQHPPTLVVAEWIVSGGTLPADRPIWVNTMCGRVGGSDTLEVMLNNAEVTEHFPGFADDVEWGDGSGTAKSWAVMHRVD
jgi:hypothetical protein